MRKNSSCREHKRIPISKEFVSAAMRLPHLFFRSDPKEDFKYSWEELEMMLLSLTRKADTGVIIGVSGELHPYIRDEMKESFGTYWILARKPERLLARDFRRDIAKNGPIHYAWASFDLLSDGSVTWTARTQPHDPGLPTPDQKVYVSLPLNIKHTLYDKSITDVA